MSKGLQDCLAEVISSASSAGSYRRKGLGSMLLKLCYGLGLRGSVRLCGQLDLPALEARAPVE